MMIERICKMSKILLYIFVMALVTYAVRMIPFVLFRKKTESRFLKSLFHYIPYAVLSAMIIPDVFYSCGGTTLADMIPAAAGFAVAVVLSYVEMSLLTVSVCSCVAVFIVNRIFSLSYF